MKRSFKDNAVHGNLFPRPDPQTVSFIACSKGVSLSFPSASSLRAVLGARPNSP
jgi:hypothetical protein